MIINKIFSIIRRIVHSKTFKIVVGLIIFVIIFIIVFAFAFNSRCSTAQPNFQRIEVPRSSELERAESKIPKYKRTEETTYITFPEWYLVFNPQEYAEFMASRRPSAFPYFGSIGQFWSSYCQVYGIAKSNYPFNIKDQIVESVIGASFSVEYVAKGIYENTIGRIFEWTTGGLHTQEDIFAAEVAKEYGLFVPDHPWYEFPFGHKLSLLWSETDLFGSHILRKFERKIFLTLEYGIKSIYAAVIKSGTHAVYGVADTEVYLSVKNVPENLFKNPKVRMVEALKNGVYIITLPHYQGFTDTAPSLAEQGIEFIDIAGNDEILLSAVAPKDWQYDLPEGSFLFETSITTDKNLKRIAIQAPVKNLASIIRTLKERGVKIEHLYDY